MNKRQRILTENEISNHSADVFYTTGFNVTDPRIDLVGPFMASSPYELHEQMTPTFKETRLQNDDTLEKQTKVDTHINESGFGRFEGARGEVVTKPLNRPIQMGMGDGDEELLEGKGANVGEEELLEGKGTSVATEDGKGKKQAQVKSVETDEGKGNPDESPEACENSENDNETDEDQKDEQSEGTKEASENEGKGSKSPESEDEGEDAEQSRPQETQNRKLLTKLLFDGAKPLKAKVSMSKLSKKIGKGKGVGKKSKPKFNVK